MPPIQTTYSDGLRAGVAGMLINTIPNTLISRTVETAAGLAFGVAVSQGAAAHGCKVFDDDVVGITVREVSLPAEQTGLDQYDTAVLITKGAIMVTAAAAVVAGDIVHALAGGTFGKTGGVLIAGARWDTTTANGALGIIRLG